MQYYAYGMVCASKLTQHLLSLILFSGDGVVEVEQPLVLFVGCHE